ncbi:MAG: hypothetical protein KAI69_07190 [Deltaproteobacteria bacterium]|nr:hypothetical protein [Deltaproteobacteria bacterium]
MLLFRREQREFNLLQQRMTKVNTAVAKLFDGPTIARVGKELGLMGKDKKLRLEKDGDTSALVDLLIFRELIDGRPPTEVYLEQQNDEFFPALQRELLEAYLEGTVFSLFHMTDRCDRRFLNLKPLLPDTEPIVLDNAILARVADDDWVFAGRFMPWKGHWIHTDLIYAFDYSAVDKIFFEFEKIDPKTSQPYMANLDRYTHFFFRIYREFGIPLGNR